MIKSKMIADSTSHLGVRICTMELEYPRFIHGELLTHRVFSRNAASSRAIPVAKMLQQVIDDPVIPHQWPANQPGMQGGDEVSEVSAEGARAAWLRARDSAVEHAKRLADLGIHKSVPNRLLEPFQWMRTLVTSTQWSNFFELRDHPAAEPHFQLLAKAARACMEDSTPVPRAYGWQDINNWHLPFLEDEERVGNPLQLAKVSAARCARVSYLTHDSRVPSMDEDLALYDRLAGGVPMHASPLEHQGAPAIEADIPSGNFVGWIQFRQLAVAVQQAEALHALQS